MLPCPMKKRTGWLLFLLVGLCLFVGLAGCAPPWRVVRQAAPNPFRPGTKFILLPIAYPNLTVGDKSEAEYQAKKKPEQQKKWQEDKGMMARTYLNELAQKSEGLVVPGKPGADSFVIQPTISFIEPGFYTYLVNRASRVRMRVLIKQGSKVLDEFTVTHSTRATVGPHVAVGGRLRTDAVYLARYTAAYLKKRLSGK